MTDTGSRDLVALVGSRIAHDLISPLGAIGNGVELLELSGVGDLPEMALISESVANANARIRMFRLAFGAAGDGMVAGSEIARLVAPGVDNRKLVIDWGPQGDQKRGLVKLAFLALMCLDTAMPYGGQVSVVAGPMGWSVTGTAERMRDLPELWAYVGAPDAPGELTPAQVHFALLGRSGVDQGRKVAVERTETAIRISFPG